MQVLIDNNQTERRARGILRHRSLHVSLDSLVFVGADEEHALAKLQESFPKGDLTYHLSKLAKDGKEKGLTVDEICKKEEI